MLLRELIGGHPPHACKLIFVDDPTGFGHRVTDGDRLLVHVLTHPAEFEQAVAGKTAEGFGETERSRTRRVFVTANRFWIVWLDGCTVGSQSGGIRADWRESSGQVKAKEFRDRDRAVAAYHRAIANARADGFGEKYERAVVIAETAEAPKTSGKKKSR
jgi:predicted DNA-binding WGR domain protein